MLCFALLCFARSAPQAPVGVPAFVEVRPETPALAHVGRYLSVASVRAVIVFAWSVPYHPVVGLMGCPNWTCNASSRIPMHIATRDLACVKCRCHIMGSTSCRRRTACNQPFWCVRHGARCKGLSSGGPQPCRGERGGTARTVLQPRWREAKKLKLAPARREARTPHLPVPDAWVR